ncbi:hypothetical protein BOX15_Mlig014508g3, partial [Macrostomum lignano]
YRLYLSDCHTAEQLSNLLASCRDACPPVESVATERCFYVQCSQQLSPEQQCQLHYLLGTDKTSSQLSASSESSSVEAAFHGAYRAEVGPRLSVTTAFSTNCVAICSGIGLAPPVQRVESSIVYRFVYNRVLSNWPDSVVHRRLTEFVHSDKLCDRMTQSVYPAPLTADSYRSELLRCPPQPVFEVDVCGRGREALAEVNATMGLSMDDWDLDYYTKLFAETIGRNPTSVECFDLAQSNSEHCRHWFFKGRLLNASTREPLLGNKYPHLMALVSSTLAESASNSVLAMCDNSSAIRGLRVPVLCPVDPAGGSELRLLPDPQLRHVILTAETHNFPTAVAPFEGAATGAGGRIRDVHATGRGGYTIAGTAGYCVGDLDERFAVEGYAAGMARPRRVLLEASDGASDYGNKFGEPLIAGFCRAFGDVFQGGERREWVKPVMFSGGIGALDDGLVAKRPAKPGDLVVKLGGPAYRIGVGGGAASSVGVQGGGGAAADELNFNAVQRGDAQMGGKLYRLVRACAELGADCNPIQSVHDQGAGGNANVLKEICEPLGADIYADKFQLGDPTLSALELWGAEYQESDACLVPPDLMERLRRIGARERCPAIDVGVVRDTGVVTLYSFGRGDSVVSDGGDGAKRARVRDPETTPVCLPLDAVLSGVPQKEFLLDCSNLRPYRQTNEQPPPPLECSQSYLLASLLSVLSCPDVGSKRFLTNKVDRSVTGLVAQQQCVGPLHTPLADVAVVALSYFDRVGGATAIGEQPIKGLLDPSRAGRMAVCEALTNLAMARVTSLADVKCSTNWMWPGKRGADGGQLVATALATVDFMKQLGVAIDGGKDSLSMAASVTNQTTGETQVIRSPGQLVVSVYAVCPDITLTLQPVLQPHAGPLIHVPLGDLPDACRLGGSAFARCSSGGGDIFGRDCPNPDADRLAAGFAAVQLLLSATSPKLLTAGHDISDGGLAVAAIEMALAAGGRCGLELRVPDSVACPTAWLMSEEPGWLLQAASNEAANQVLDRLNSAGLSTGVRIVGLATVAGELRIVAGDRVLLDKVSLADLREAWERPSHQLELAQCQPDCARSELRYLREAGGANQYVATATEPCLLPSVDRLLAMERRFTVAIIREEGSNGDREMAAAFYAAGFRVLDVTTGDLAADGDGEDGVSLADCRGVAFVGGFSYADVLGSAKGWAAQVQFHPSVRRELDALRRRGNSFSLGVCNGCQLMARIGWLDGDSDSGSSDSSAPVTLEPNLSGRFESRYPTVRVLPTSCPLLRGMSDSRLGVWSAHGEGRFSVASADSLLAAGRVPLVYVDQAGEATESYPCNPNGSPKGLAAVCSPCGRHLAMMPHPERSFLTWQCPAGQQASTNSSDDNNLASPWFKMFVNAYEFCCETE